MKIRHKKKFQPRYHFNAPSNHQTYGLKRRVVCLLLPNPVDIWELMRWRLSNYENLYLRETGSFVIVGDGRVAQLLPAIFANNMWCLAGSWNDALNMALIMFGSRKPLLDLISNVTFNGFWMILKVLILIHYFYQSSFVKNFGSQFQIQDNTEMIKSTTSTPWIFH